MSTLGLYRSDNQPIFSYPATYSRLPSSLSLPRIHLSDQHIYPSQPDEQHPTTQKTRHRLAAQTTPIFPVRDTQLKKMTRPNISTRERTDNRGNRQRSGITKFFCSKAATLASSVKNLRLRCNAVTERRTHGYFQLQGE